MTARIPFLFCENVEISAHALGAFQGPTDGGKTRVRSLRETIL
jgi:hypothetical protein